MRNLGIIEQNLMMTMRIQNDIDLVTEKNLE